MLAASVIICTHDPRPDYLARVLSGLRNQTLPLEKWELLIVDNASRLPLASSCDVSWHPNARHIFESELGLTSARRRGIHEAAAELIIFVDDDNVLHKTYLAEAIRIEQEWPFLGVWGSGCIPGDLEVELPESLRKHRSWLPLRDFAAPRWSNLPYCEETMPMGAGLCVRKNIAIAYSQFCDQSSIQMTDRQGSAQYGKGDTEISFFCCSHGLGTGVFPALKLTHLIPQHRLSESYFTRLAEGTYISDFLLYYKWRQIIPQSLYSVKTMLTILKTILLYRGVDRDIRLAWVRALVKANRIIRADLRKKNEQGSDVAARALSNASVGADSGNT